MKILDCGHIYVLHSGPCQINLTFVKRSGGAITYEREWPGLQTQAVMRAVIDYIKCVEDCGEISKNYRLWQLGTPALFDLTIGSIRQVIDLLAVMIDRSRYLDSIIPCVETKDACEWMTQAMGEMSEQNRADCVRMALWCYEVRAYRRKVESVNRKQPEHDDTSRPRPWRSLTYDDVPFDHHDIELRPIGDDGHLLTS